ncbi:MAG: outer membrane protein assembly factor BamD [Verrucomicrobiota bacterium]|jgi:predicted negative regulator of RcsB-dependent stress response
MKRPLLIAMLAAWPVWAAAQNDDVQARAEAALRNGVPQTAISPLKEALRKGQGDDAVLSRLLARLQLAAGSPEEALATLDARGNGSGEEWKVLRGAALAAQGGWDAATAVLQPLATTNPEAILLLARIRTERGDRNSALELLSKLPRDAVENPQALRLLIDLELSAGDTAAAAKLLEKAESEHLLPEPETQTAKGRLLLGLDRPKEAAELFEAVLAVQELPPQVHDNARLGLSRASQAAGDNTKARNLLREALGSGKVSAALRETMEAWVALEQTSGADPSGDLRSWSAEKEARRGIEASLQLAQLDLDANGTEAATASLQKLLGRKDLEPGQRSRAEFLLAEAKIASGQASEALSTLDAMEGGDAYRLAMLRGRALAASGANRQAHETFTQALNNAETATQKSTAAANGFITALATGDLALTRNSWEALRAAAPDHPRLLEWSFLMAAAEAQQGDIDGLTALARRTPSTEYSFQAKVALAEWRLARGEADAAARILKTAEPEAEAPARAAALDAAAIFAADNAGSKTRGELVADCQSFLARHADAPEAADISFKLAELHARGGDHAAAETILARQAETLKDGESAALAKFLAAQAAARSMSDAAADRALIWLNELAQGQSSFKHRARFEQASLLLRQKKTADALALYDSTLAADPPDDVRQAARMERADILFAMSATEPGKLDEAAAAYELVINDQTAPPDWRDQAACKRGTALARRGQTEKALALYREILDRSPAQGADQYWFLKAGMDAARLLEEQQDWAAAVAVYDRLASASGAQREELEQRARRLKLEHFIWEN